VCEICGEEKFHNSYCACCGEHCKRKSKLTCKQQWCTLCFLVVLPCYLVLGGILQFICFHYATLKCGSGSLPENYEFPGGEESPYGNASFNLVPQYSVLVETDKRWYGNQFDSYVSNDNLMKQQKIGTWFQTWGPFFSTYTYEDIQHGWPTIYMRGSWQRMFFKYNDDYIMRCDGKGDVIRISEGAFWFQNRVKGSFSSNTGYKLKIMRDGTQVAEAEETFHGGKSITFRNTSMPNAAASDTEFAQSHEQSSAAGEKDRWGVSVNGPNDRKKHTVGNLAYYQVQAMSVLYAFRIFNGNQKAIGSKANKNSQSEMASLTDETFQIKPKNFEKFHTIGLNESYVEQGEVHA